MKSIVQHLRFPFSVLLLPTFLFALSRLENDLDLNVLTVLFVALHLFIYPSSNAYNSLQDQDKGSIGLIEHPDPVPNSLGYISIIMDLVGLILLYIINIYCSMLGLIYILASRMYSFRKIRIKKYPWASFFLVVLCQGTLIYYLTIFAMGSKSIKIIDLFAASLMIGGTYPITQVYQHQQDQEDGVETLSMRLGILPTFQFCILLNAFFLLLLVLPEVLKANWLKASIIFGFTMPLAITLLIWYSATRKNIEQANFKNVMRFNLLSSITMILLFTLLIFLH